MFSVGRKEGLDKGLNVWALEEIICEVLHFGCVVQI